MKRSLFLLMLVLWLLACAILATIYLAWLTYPLTIDYFQLERWSGLSKSTIMANFNQLMSYLLSPFEKQLIMSHFPVSTSGLKHFADVKILFQVVQGIFIALIIPSLLVLKSYFHSKTLWKCQKVWLWAILVPIIIAVFGMLVGFEAFFVFFHQILFPGDSSWLFNPETDPIILVLPAQFFLACFVLFFLIYQGIFSLLLFLSKRQWRQFRAKMCF